MFPDYLFVSYNYVWGELIHDEALVKFFAPNILLANKLKTKPTSIHVIA